MQIDKKCRLRLLSAGKASCAVLILGTLAACVVAKPVPLPDGVNGYAISKCSDMAECYRKAAEVCGGDYKLFNQSTNTSGAVMNGAGSIGTDYTITVTCVKNREQVIGDPAP